MRTPQSVLRSGQVLCPWCEYERLQGLSMRVRDPQGGPRKQVMMGLGCPRCGLVIQTNTHNPAKSDMSSRLQRRVSRARARVAGSVPTMGSLGPLRWEAGNLEVRWKTLGLPEGLTWAFRPQVCVEIEKPDLPRRRPARGGLERSADPGSAGV
jgi:hypothetical protein